MLLISTASSAHGIRSGAWIGFVLAAWSAMTLTGCTPPSQPGNPYLETTVGDYVVLTVADGDIAGLAFLRRRDTEIVLQVIDRNRDGKPDELVYSGAPGGAPEVRINDYGFDGQADLRRHADGTEDLWLEGEWHRVERDAQGMYIRLGEDQRRIEQGQWGWLQVSGS